MANNLIAVEIDQQRTATVNRKSANWVKKGQLEAARKKLEAMAPNRGCGKRVRRVG